MKILSILFCAALCSGCIQTLAVSTVGSIVEDGFEGFTEEQDLPLAEQALPGNLKMLEVMLKNDPENTKLLTLLAEGYNSYALGFVEDVDAERAKIFYLRARDYALRILRQDGDLARTLEGPLEDFKSLLAKKGKDHVPAAFWAAFGWGSYVYLSLSNPEAVASLPRIEALMQFVAARDSSFYYAGAYVFLGTLYGSRPKIFGGDAVLARQYFERALAINGGKFLMTYFYFARSVAVQTQNEELFDELLSKIDAASLEILPKFRLANAIAKRKAKLLESRKAEKF